MRDDLCCGTMTFKEPVTLEWLKERNELFSALCGNILLGLTGGEVREASWILSLDHEVPDWLCGLQDDTHPDEYQELLREWWQEEIGRFFGCSVSGVRIGPDNWEHHQELVREWKRCYGCADVVCFDELAAKRQKKKKGNALQGSLTRLDSLIGMEKAKEQLHDIAAIVKNRGADSLPCLHTVLLGNPGTGKTELARCYAGMLADLGVVEPNKFIETDRSGLVGKYVGHTAKKTRRVIEQARGGVLFIDEAYALGRSDNERDFGPEAIDTLVKAMEDMRGELVVVMAGYPELMDKMLSVNPGLRQRVGFTLSMDDYAAPALCAIAAKMISDKGYTLDEDARELLDSALYRMEASKDKDFANARVVRKVVERCIFKQNVRTSGNAISAQDVQSACKDPDLACLMERKLSVVPVGFRMAS